MRASFAMSLVAIIGFAAAAPLRGSQIDIPDQVNDGPKPIQGKQHVFNEKHHDWWDAEENAGAASGRKERAVRTTLPDKTPPNTHQGACTSPDDHDCKTVATRESTKDRLIMKKRQDWLEGSEVAGPAI